MSAAATNDPTAIALRALAATLSEQRLAERFISLSGIEPPELRQRASDPDVLVAEDSHGHGPQVIDWDELQIARWVGQLSECSRAPAN